MGPIHCGDTEDTLDSSSLKSSRSGQTMGFFWDGSLKRPIWEPAMVITQHINQMIGGHHM